MSKNKYLILVIIILGFLFYWYSYRPEQIKKECYKESYDKPGFRFNSNEDMYKECILSKGLK